MPFRTFLDSGVLIAAGRADNLVDRRMAVSIIRSPHRTFLTSHFVALEVLPRATRERNITEIRASKNYFAASEAIDDLSRIARRAFEVLKERSDVGLADGLHIAAASLLNADELVTTEKPNKPMHRTSFVKIVHLEDVEP